MQAATITTAATTTATTTATTGDYKELFIANSPNSGDCRWHCQRRCRRRSCLSFKMQGLARLGSARLGWAWNGLERGTWNMERARAERNVQSEFVLCVVRARRCRRRSMTNLMAQSQQAAGRQQQRQRQRQRSHYKHR